MRINPANIVSIVRTLMVFVFVYLIVHAQGAVAAVLWGVSIIVIAVLLDGVDGPIARAFGYEGETGKLTDLYADHVTANAVWVTLAVLGTVSVWVPLLTTTRDFTVDLCRQAGAVSTGLNGFQQVSNSRFRWLVSSRAMRFLYAAAKLIVWCTLILGLLFPIPDSIQVLVWMVVGLCLLRAIPAINASWRYIVFARL